MSRRQNLFSDTELVEKVLSPYKINCRYLKGAQVEIQSTATNISGSILARGQFSIPDSFYIADTGHFNAVDFNICYNQLGYYLLAEFIQNKLLDSFLDWSVEDYFRFQLSHIFIGLVQKVPK